MSTPPCNLVQAIREANGETTNVGSCEAGTDGAGATGADTIVIPSGSATYTVTSAATTPPAITTTIRINGNGNTISGGDAYTLIAVDPGGDLTIDNWILTNGACNTSNLCHGGAIFVRRGKLTLQNSVVKNSTAGSEASLFTGSGGGIRVEGIPTATATLSITNSSIYGNRAANNGGGISVVGTFTFTMSGSAVYSNTASGPGGGLDIQGTHTTGTTNSRITNNSIFGNTAGTRGGGIYANYTYPTNLEQYLNVTFTTITGNTANTSDAVKGGGVYATNVRFQLRYSIISGNTNQNCQVTSSAIMGALLTNIIGSGSSSNCTVNQETGDPRLLPMTSGSPPYYKFYSDSPALNKVSTASCNSLATADQAGNTRPRWHGLRYRRV